MIHVDIDRVVASAPGRVNLVGEHTDYNGGFALPLALPHRTTATLRRRDDRAVTATSSSRHGDPAEFGVDTEPGDVSGWGAYVAGVFWALRQAGHDIPGADVHIDSDVPSGAGLSSSAALECAVIVALDALAELELDPTTLALLAQRAENSYVGAPTGAMDQIAAMHGSDGHVILFDAGRLKAEPVPCDLAGAALTLLIIDTRAPHRHVDGEYGARRRSCEHAASRLGVPSLRDIQAQPVDEVLARLESNVSLAWPADARSRTSAGHDDDADGTGSRANSTGSDAGDHPAEPLEIMRKRVRHILTENQRVLDTVALLRAQHIREIGPLLTASHVSLRDDYEVTVPELDVAVDSALEAGALGARMTGGGFGGSVIALVDRERTDTVAGAVRDAFARGGFTEPHTFVAVPSAGAGVASPTSE